MRHRDAVVVTVMILLAATAVAQADQTDDYVRAQMKQQRIPGLSLVVLRDGQIVKVAGYGVADRKTNVPATPDTVYKIGSVSKQFIATGVMLLVQERQLNLADPLSKFLDAAPPTWNGITIRHLLTHTSGLVREAPGFDAFKVQSDADLLRTAYPLPLHFAPGDKYEYSNVGYFALAEVIRKVSGRPWPEYLHENVFKPAGMTATHPTNTTVRVPNLASGYSDNDRLLDAENWTALRPSGAFLSTVRDLAKWDAVLYTDKVLSEASRREMWTPVTLNDGTSAAYGFGWQVESLSGRKNVHHGAGMPGFGAELARFVDDRLTVALLVNLDDCDEEAIAAGVALLYLAAPPAGR